MSIDSTVFIVVPAYNVAQRRFRSVLEQLGTLPYRVVVVDDGSTDTTAEIGKQYTSVVRHEINRGQGAALMTGMAYALRQGATILVHFDADGQMDPADIVTAVQLLQTNPQLDIILGSRFLKANTIPWTKKYLIQKPALWFQRLTTGLPLTDVHNGFRAMTAAAAKRLEIKQDRMAHASEIILLIKRLGLRYQEIPVTIRYFDYGQGMLGGLRILRDLFTQQFIK